MKPHQMTLAYTQVLQYWAEEANPPAPSEPSPLAMSVRQLRWHIGKYITFNKHDVFEGLGNALPEAKNEDTETQSVDDHFPLLPVYKSEAKDEDTGTPQADSTVSPAITDAKDTQPSPEEISLADDTTAWVAKPDTGIQKGLPAT